MSTFILVTGIIIAVSALTFSYFKNQRRQQSAKPEFADKECINQLEFPQNYGKNQLTLLVRDPEWLYAYWEITATVQSDFSRQFGGIWSETQPMLRVYDITGGNQKQYFDIQIDDYSSNWYIHVGRPNHTFFVDLGRVLPDGRFYCIARSNSVTTPNNRISDVIDPDWVPIEAIWSSLREQEIEAGLSSPEFLQRRSD